MYELVQISEHDYYIDCPCKIGIVQTAENEVVLIDSGSDKDTAKKIFRILESKGWNLRAVYNTHSHADHIGGNAFLQQKTGCRIYAKGLEQAYANAPILEPAGLYGGLPFKDLKNKFLMAKESHVLPLTEDVLPEGMEMISLPGHCFEMTGFKTADGTAFIADSVSSAETLAKYGIGYLWDPQTALKTLSYLKTIKADRFVPAHAPVAEEIVSLAEQNIQAILMVKENILKWCQTPVTFEGLLKIVFDEYNLRMNAQQYVLIGSTLRSYLSCMYEQGEVIFQFVDNEMVWAVK